MAVSKKIKTINNKIQLNKAQHNLDRQTAEILALSAENASKYKCLMGRDVLSENDLLEKTATIKIFEYLPLGSKLKNKLTLQKMNTSPLKIK